MGWKESHSSASAWAWALYICGKVCRVAPGSRVVVMQASVSAGPLPPPTVRSDAMRCAAFAEKAAWTMVGATLAHYGEFASWPSLNRHLLQIPRQ